jgi:hypothetical protein
MKECPCGGMVDTQDLKSCELKVRTGSSPVGGTNTYGTFTEKVSRWIWPPAESSYVGRLQKISHTY